MRVGEEIVSKNKSKNFSYNDTRRWDEAQNVIKYTEQNGGKETTVEIPAGGVREKIAEQEKKIQSNKFQLINSAFSSATITASSSEFSISSLPSSEENHGVKKNSDKSKIPVRSNSNASFSSNNSISSHTRSYETRSGIPISIGSSLFKKGSFKDNTQNLYKINKAKSWILISPELLDSVKSENLIKTDSKANALTYRETDKVRLMDLTKKEILILEENLPRLCESLKGNEKINIFRS